MHASIWLKFGTHISGLNANASIEFWVNLINIQAILHIKQSRTSFTPTG